MAMDNNNLSLEKAIRQLQEALFLDNFPNKSGKCCVSADASQQKPHDELKPVIDEYVLATTTTLSSSWVNDLPIAVRKHGGQTDG